MFKGKQRHMEFLAVPTSRSNVALEDQLAQGLLSCLTAALLTQGRPTVRVGAVSLQALPSGMRGQSLLDRSVFSAPCLSCSES